MSRPDPRGADRGAALREVLQGWFDTEHAITVERVLANIDCLDETITELSIEIEEQIAPFATAVELPRTPHRQASRLLGRKLPRQPPYASRHHRKFGHAACFIRRTYPGSIRPTRS
jgi:hypothetical protein